MTKREMTCIICPMGCPVTVEMRGEEIASIRGNTCKRGAAYAEAEVRHPERTVTSTMRCENGGILSVKTDRPMPIQLNFRSLSGTSCCQTFSEAMW